MRLPRRPEGIIFDLDGVLLDTEPLYTRATQEVVSEWGKTYGFDVKSRLMGRDEAESARVLVEALDLPITPEEYRARVKPELEALLAEARAMLGAEALVHALARRELPLAVATSGVRHLTDIKRARHAWFHTFDAIVCGDDPRIGRPKPAPDIFHLAAREIDVPSERCVVFEDSIAGVEAAVAAGMLVIAVPDPRADRAAYAGATLVVESLAAVSLADLGLE